MAQNTGADQAKHELDPRRKAALDTALAQVEKSFGKGSAMRLGDRPEQNVEVIPTGSLALDMALGIGGLPKGRIVEVYGPESSGKTTLALHVVANAQKAGGVAAFIDAEHAFQNFHNLKTKFALHKTFATRKGYASATDIIKAFILKNNYCCFFDRHILSIKLYCTAETHSFAFATECTRR